MISRMFGCGLGTGGDPSILAVRRARRYAKLLAVAIDGADQAGGAAGRQG
jgi:hypothetical protein